MQLHKVGDSSSIEEYGYDPEKRILRVRYISGDAYYDFANVEPAKYHGLLAAPSKGHYLHANIRSLKDKDGLPLHKSTKVETVAKSS